MAPTPRLSVSQLSGRPRCHFDQRKQDRCAQMGGCWWWFLTVKLLCITSSFHNVRRWIGGFYVAVLKCLRDVVRQNGPKKCESGLWMLHHDIVAAHSALSTQESLTKHNIPLVPPTHHIHQIWHQITFFLFQGLKRTIKVKKFQDVPNIIQNLTRELKAIPKEEYQRSFKNGRTIEIIILGAHFH